MYWHTQRGRSLAQDVTVGPDYSISRMFVSPESDRHPICNKCYHEIVHIVKGLLARAYVCLNTVSTIIATQLAAPQSVGQPVAPGGERAISLALDFSTNTSFSLITQQSGGLTNFGLIQGIYFDATALIENAPQGVVPSVTIQFPVTGQKLMLRSGTQGYLSVLCPNPAQINFIGNNTLGVLALQFLNYPVRGVIWQ